MAEFVCTKPCWHKGRKWRKGDVANFDSGEAPKGKKGELLHFEQISGAAPEVPAEPGPLVAVNDKKRR